MSRWWLIDRGWRLVWILFILAGILLLISCGIATYKLIWFGLLGHQP